MMARRRLNRYNVSENRATPLRLIRQTRRSQELNPGPPGLQVIWYWRRNSIFCGRVCTGRMGLCCFFVVLCPGTPEGPNGIGSGFKASQKSLSLIRQTGRSREWNQQPLVYKAYAKNKHFVTFPG